MEGWFFAPKPVVPEENWFAELVRAIIYSDEVSLATDIITFIQYLADLRVFGLLVVATYVFLWVKLESLATTRAETERKQAEINYDCENRKNLREYCIEKHGELYYNFGFHDFFRHVGTQGRHKPNMHDTCSMASKGVIWKTPHLIVLSTPLNTALYGEVLNKTSMTIEEGLYKIRVGGTLEALDRKISWNFHPQRYYVNCDDPDAFLSLFKDATMLKRLSKFTARQVIDGSYDFQAKTITLKSNDTDSVVLKNMSVEEFYGFALTSAHLSYQTTK